MICKTCGERMEGDGVTTPFHCPTLDVPDSKPDATPLHCSTLQYEPPYEAQDAIEILTGIYGVSRGTAYDIMRETLKESSQYQDDTALLRKALDAITNVLSGADFDNPYLDLKKVSKDLEERLK